MLIGEILFNHIYGWQCNPVEKAPGLTSNLSSSHTSSLCYFGALLFESFSFPIYKVGEIIPAVYEYWEGEVYESATWCLVAECGRVQIIRVNGSLTSAWVKGLRKADGN